MQITDTQITDSDLLAMRIADALAMLAMQGTAAKLNQLNHADRELLCLTRARIDALNDNLERELPELDADRVSEFCHFLGCSHQPQLSLCEKITILLWRALQFLLCRNDFWILDEEIQQHATAIRLNKMNVIEKHWDAYLDYHDVEMHVRI